MLIELDSQFRITIPSCMVESMGLTEGDLLDVEADNGSIRLTPVVEYPEETVERLNRLAADARAQGLEAYESIEDAIAALHETTR